ncbi:unnamed protein product [Closterium sp. NIES-65]|nr:unnamed protein product [Closterium sp. NIES-65]
MMGIRCGKKLGYMYKYRPARHSVSTSLDTIVATMDTSLASDDTLTVGRARRVSHPPAYLRASYQLTLPRGRLSNGKCGPTLPKRLSVTKKGDEVVQHEQVDTDGHDVRISSWVLEQLIRAQDRSAKENARLEAMFLNAMAERSGGSRKRKARKQRDPEQGCMNPKRKRGETWSGGSDDDGEDDEEDTHGSGGRHMRTAKSPILQRALAHLPTDKAWKRVCELARVHLFLNRPTSSMTFYPSSDDKTHGVCAVLDRLPHSFACLALAADKSRRADLNKTLSEWKTRAAARVRDIALPKLGLFRDDRDASSPWAPEKERSIDKIRERIGLGADPPETLVLTSWVHDRDGMPFASRAFATCAKAAFKPKKAGLVMTLKEARKGRLSNSAGGNAHVVDGLKVLVKEAVERAIRIRNPEYEAEREAWIWGRHGLRISACGLEHMKPAAATELQGIVGDDDLSASLGDE